METRLCDCGRESSNEAVTKVLHKGLGIVIRDNSDEHKCTTCHERDMLTEFDSLNKCRYKLGTLISKGHTELHINWEEFGTRLSVYPEDTSGIKALRMSGLLSLEPKNAWDIVIEGHLHVGPVIGTSYYYFANLELAKEYARTVIGYTRINIWFLHIDVVTGQLF